MFIDLLGDFLDSVLTRLILLLYSNDNPVIENVEDLESLAGDLVQDQGSPREEEIQAHREVLSFDVENFQNLLV